MLLPMPIPNAPFILLRDPASYVACSWDLVADDIGRSYWCQFFVHHIRLLAKLGVEAAVIRGESRESAQQRAENCFAEFDHIFQAFEQDGRSRPTTLGSQEARVTILTLDEWRDQLLRKHGFVDAMIDLKNIENERAIVLLQDVIKDLDAIADPRQQLHTAVVGVFAGNRFDMGAKASSQQYLAGTAPNFADTRAQITRPFLIDDLDAFSDYVLGKPITKAVFFIDNAGSDFLLGAVPLTRLLASRGTHVVIAANERPTLNDMTVHDVRAWWPKVCERVPGLAKLPIEIVSTGTGEPLIDLSKVSDELNHASQGAGLVILEGMGRGVESNLDAEFLCPAVNLAMLKDEMIATRLGGKLFDSVCRFR